MDIVAVREAARTNQRSGRLAIVFSLTLLHAEEERCHEETRVRHLAAIWLLPEAR